MVSTTEALLMLRIAGDRVRLLWEMTDPKVLNIEITLSTAQILCLGFLNNPT